MMLLLLLVLIPLFAVAQPVRLTAHSQKFRVFYAPSDPKIPAMQGLTVKASDGATWTASSDGLWRRDPRAAERDREQYFAGKRYLPDDDISGLAPDKAGGVWVKTKTGASHIEFRRLTLAQKAAVFEDRIEVRHIRHGFTSDSDLREPGKIATSHTVSSDNDGLWTAMYVAGELYRYSVTKSDDALRRARRGLEAILFLEQVTGRPGFPARSYVDATEQRPRDGIWYPTPDGKLQWKADTSSDEIVGHMLVFGLGWDLLPKDDPLRPRLAATCRRIMDHILTNGYNLIDVSGKPTTWGKWTQAYFDSPKGRADSPLNAIELLSFLKTTHHVTGDSRYDAEYRKVAVDLKYAETGARYQELRKEINYSDEELAMLSFYPLFIYEKDPRFLDYYRRAADQWWLNIKRELNPLWTYIYALGRPDAKLDMDGAAWTLYRLPMDLVTWDVDNTRRKDLPPDPGKDRFKGSQTTKLIPPDERPVMKWNSNPFRLRGGNGGRSEDDGATLTLPYWLGRYHHFLAGE